MRAHAPALALAAGVFVSSRVHAEEKLAPPRLVLSDVVGFGTTGSTGWFGYTRYGSHTDAGAQEHNARPEQRGKTSQLIVAPRVEVLFGEYVSLGAEITYSRFSSGHDTIGLGGTSSRSTTSDRFTLVPILGLRVPLPRRFSLWAHAGFGGGAAVSSQRGELPGLPSDADSDSAQLVTRFRTDLRLAFEPVRGVMLTAGPELQRTALGNDKALGSSSVLSAGVWAGVSFVIR